ncbi:hypothetical protein FRC08_016636 [Ceratobasidium sp. 394]|nr:hypothetical protein FRC08_016636 [Ceratobasidium sp. 394]
MQEMRLEAANEVADYHYLVLQLTNEEFGEQHGLGHRGLRAQALFKDDAYVFDPCRSNDNKRKGYERLFCSQAMLRATQLLLTGPSSVSADIWPVQASTCWAALWHLKAITPSILLFVSIVVHFVLSGD